MKNRIIILPLLRAVAATMVCLYHFITFQSPDGSLFDEHGTVVQLAHFGLQGVYIFFVVSGFIIPFSLDQAGYKLYNFWQFLLKRFMRLHPPYLLSLVLCGLTFFLYAVWYWQDFHLDWNKILYHVLFIVPFSEHEWYNPVYWTLALEFQFYFVMALMMPLLQRSRLLALGSMILFLLSGFALSDNRMVFLYAPVFIPGISVYLWRTKMLHRWELLVLSGICVALCYRNLSPATAIAVALAIVSLIWLKWYSVISDHIGEWSYSLYLTHNFAGGQFIWFLRSFAVSMFSKVLIIAGAIVISLLFAWGYWKLIEIPSMRWASRVQYKRITKAR
jgi:peptidoglycan/LPS O-acetylase OafA/YrhL